jgi:preprotein translocase subunit Sss1
VVPVTYILTWSLVGVVIIIMGVGFFLYLHMRVLKSGEIATD